MLNSLCSQVQAKGPFSMFLPKTVSLGCTSTSTSSAVTPSMLHDTTSGHEVPLENICIFSPINLPYGEKKSYSNFLKSHLFIVGVTVYPVHDLPSSGLPVPTSSILLMYLVPTWLLSARVH